MGDLEEIEKEEAREKSRNSLNERQEAALAEVCDAWEEGRHEMTAAWLVERLPAKYAGEDPTRKARANSISCTERSWSTSATSAAGTQR